MKNIKGIFEIPKLALNASGRASKQPFTCLRGMYTFGRKRHYYAKFQYSPLEEELCGPSAGYFRLFTYGRFSGLSFISGHDREKIVAKAGFVVARWRQQHRSTKRGSYDPLRKG